MGITRGPLHGRVLETGRDDMGRWVYTKFHTSRNKNITIIGAHQPINKTAKQTGPESATTQQYSVLQQEGRHEAHRVRHHYVNDICNFVNKCHQQDELVMLGGDLNEVLGDDVDGLTKLCSECGLVDVHNHRHGIDTHTFRPTIEVLNA